MSLAETITMNRNGANPYASPTKCGLKIVEVTEEPDLFWEFNMLVLWEDLETSKRYFASDSGCSCPSPFEDITSLGDMTPFDGAEAEYERTRRSILGRN